MEIDAKFDFDPKKAENFVKTELNTLIKKTTIDIHNEVVTRTPVDTGRARASWDYSFTTSNGVVEGHINNYVEYIVYLEHGWSDQAPAGMVAISLTNAAERLS